MDFIAGVNRLFRINAIIKGDDDNITTFSDTQHASDIELAKIAIQDELSEIISDRLLPYEKTSSTITLTTGTRAYALETNFVRFYGTKPSFYYSANNYRIYEYAFGEDRLRDMDYSYATATSSPVYWYWNSTTTKQVAFYPIPDSSWNNVSLSYDYEKSVMVSDSTDTLPFHNNEEAYAFVTLAARRFKFMIAEQPMGLLPQDPTYANAKARLYNFLKPTDAYPRYGRTYL